MKISLHGRGGLSFSAEGTDKETYRGLQTAGVWPLAGLKIAPGAPAPLTIRLISVGSLPPVLLGFLQEGVTRELGAVVRIEGNLPLPASCPEGAGQCPGDPFSRPWPPSARGGRR